MVAQALVHCDKAIRHIYTTNNRSLVTPRPMSVILYIHVYAILIQQFANLHSCQRELRLQLVARARQSSSSIRVSSTVGGAAKKAKNKRQS